MLMAYSTVTVRLVIGLVLVLVCAVSLSTSSLTDKLVKRQTRNCPAGVNSTLGVCHLLRSQQILYRSLPLASLLCCEIFLSYEDEKHKDWDCHTSCTNTKAMPQFQSVVMVSENVIRVQCGCPCGHVYDILSGCCVSKLWQGHRCSGSFTTQTGDYSLCQCGLQFRTVSSVCCETTGLHSACRHVASCTERRSCQMHCTSGQRQPVPQSVIANRVQCSCPAGYTYDQTTGCCNEACLASGLTCKRYQKCLTQHNVVYCEDTCSGYSCPRGQECYLRVSTSCRVYRGVRICPRVAGCRYTDPCSLVKCRDYEDCVVTTYRVVCRLKDHKPGNCPVLARRGQCYDWRSLCSKDSQCVGASKCCWDGCRLRCVLPHDPNNPCSSVDCNSYQVCNAHNGTAYCLDTCSHNGPCSSNRVCRLVDQNCNGRLPCPKKAVCEKPRCAGHRYTLRTNRRIGILHYPGRVTNANCGQFEGSLIIVATNGLCLKITADRRYPDTRQGEMVEVYDGYVSNRLLYRRSSLRGVQVVSSGPIVTIILKTPDISTSNGLYVLYSLQESCRVEPRPTISLPTTPTPALTTTPPVLITEPTTMEPTTEKNTLTDGPKKDLSSGDNICVDPCPTPRLGCEVIKENENDCCGEEKCYVLPIRT